MLSAAAVLCVFVVAAFVIQHAIAQNTAFQRNLRLAQVDRSRLLRTQIDEESGMRGFTDTRERTFLQPYTLGVPAFNSTAALLNARLEALSLDTAPLRDQVRINRQWLQSVARPLIADPNARDELAIQLKGKQLVDRFRADDAKISDGLVATADAGEAATARFVRDTLLGSILIGLVLAAVLAWLSSAQARLAAEVEMQRRAYLEEKRIADQLQEAFVQKTLPQLAHADLHAVYRPAGGEARVGGDWYDAFELDSNRILFSIGDVAGHGVEAAVVMSRVRQAVLAVGIDEPDPAIVLARVNDILLLQDITVVTAICGMIDLTHGVITFANAGHPPALITSEDGKIESIGATGPPLGAVDRPTYTAKTVVAAPGSVMTLYTDGLIEYNRDFVAGERRLLDAVRRMRRDSKDLAASLMHEIFNGEAPEDDVAILTVRFRDAQGEPGGVTLETHQAAKPILGRQIRTLLASGVSI